MTVMGAYEAEKEYVRSVRLVFRMFRYEAMLK